MVPVPKTPQTPASIQHSSSVGPTQSSFQTSLHLIFSKHAFFRFPVTPDVVAAYKFDAVLAKKYFIVCVPTVYGKLFPRLICCPDHEIFDPFHLDGCIHEPHPPPPPFPYLPPAPIFGNLRTCALTTHILKISFFRTCWLRDLFLCIPKPCANKLLLYCF